MIRQETVEAGIVVKTHGVYGELVIDTAGPDFFENIKEPIFLNLEGLLVPFFIHNAHVISQHRVRVQFDTITSENKARKLIGCKVYVPLIDNKDEDEIQVIPSPDAIKTFEVIDKKYGSLGFVSEVVNLNTNPVMQVINQTCEILIPFHPEFIKKINFRKKQINVVTPEGLIDLYR